MMSAQSRPGGSLVCVVGARPNYMKMAPLVRAFEACAAMPPVTLVHTGQHYDVAMNETLFADLELPPPDINLEVGSGTHALQTAEIMRRFEPVIDELRPSGIVVVGDVNSTLSCALVAAKKCVPVFHVEAGLRSYDRTMPEEINRVVTDQLAEALYTTERSATANLVREGIDVTRVCFAGNVMIDSLLRHRSRAAAPESTFARAGIGVPPLGEAGFGVVTLHRPSNVDEASALRESVLALKAAAKQIPLVWPLHPRARANLGRFGCDSLVADAEITLLPPLGYLEMLGLLCHARVVLTDSGGVQEETTALGVPCLTMRENTERPITIEEGTNLLVGRDPELISREVANILRGGGKRGRIPELWDGNAAPRIASDLSARLGIAGVQHEAATA